MSESMGAILTFEKLELRTEQDKRTRRMVERLYLLTLEFEPQVFMSEHPCLICGNKPEAHEFKVVNSKLFHYCPRSQITIGISVYGITGEEFAPWITLKAEKKITPKEAVEWIRRTRSVVEPHIMMALM